MSEKILRAIRARALALRNNTADPHAMCDAKAIIRYCDLGIEEANSGS